MFQADFGNHFRGEFGGTRRRVKFPVVVQFDNFNVGHVLCDFAGSQHHQHGTECEVGRDKCGRGIFFCRVTNFFQVVRIQTRRADNGRNFVFKRSHNVAENRVGTREIDHDFGLNFFQRGVQICFDVETFDRAFKNVTGADKFQFGICFDGGADSATHATERAVDQNFNHR